MKRRRISNQVMEEAVQKVLPMYQLSDAERPDGEYADESKFTFVRTNNVVAFPKKFYISVVPKADEMYDISIEYDQGESRTIYGENKFSLINEVKDAIRSYSGFLDIKQTQEVIERYVRECFTRSYIEKNRAFFEGRVRDIVNDFHNGSEDEFGRIKSGMLYARLEKEVLWLPVRHVENHFEYTFPTKNFARDKRDKALIGSVYKVQLPLRAGKEFGGGTKRPCIVIGQSSRGFFYVAPLQHIRNEDLRNEDYFVYNDEYGQPVYLVEGFIECVQENDIHAFMSKVDKQTYERICSLISKDNKLQTGVYDFSVGMGSTSSDDRYKAKINAYDKNFKFPNETELYRIIENVLLVEEKIKKSEIYNKVGNLLDFKVSYINTDIIFNFSMKDGNAKIVKFSLDAPVDVLSNYKNVSQSKLTPDKVISANYRRYMNKKYPLFKYMLLKRLTTFFYGCYHRGKANNEAEMLENTMYYFQRHLSEANLMYEGDLGELIQFGIEKIELSKLKEREVCQYEKTQLPKKDDEEEISL